MSAEIGTRHRRMRILAAVMTARTLSLGGSAYPIILPSIRDPRLHVAAVIISVHVLGQVGLHFQVTVPQILAAILTCFVIEVALTFRASRALVWPASAMLTGSGVALIMRVVGTPSDDPWNPYAWHLFAIVAGGSLLTKYVVKRGGSHVFNPSNVGLVVAFAVLGSSQLEPLDFWWAPLEPPMLAAYAVILAGGLLITARLRLLALAASFWLTFAISLGVLAASGHCMTARWAFGPVCGVDYWRVIVTSPEVLIFLFFMITDPKTIPSGRVGRVGFGILVALASTLLMAPQTTEFATKVALLGGLVLICAARPVLDRLVPQPRSAADDVGPWAMRLATGRGRASTGVRLATTGVAAVAVTAGIVAAGGPARGAIAADTGEVLDRVPHQVDPSTFPAITVGQDVTDWDHAITGPGAREVVLTLAENLELENQALLRRDASILAAVDHGDRLIEMQGRLEAAAATGRTVIARYRFDSLHLSLVVPFGVQTGLSLGIDARGTVTYETVDAGGQVEDRSSSPFEGRFVVRRATGDRWLNVAVLPGEGNAGR
jgi:Na+-transporting NADH:ubiquinone oxidoreductase subunit NqrB